MPKRKYNLTTDDAARIKAELEAGTVTITELAPRYGMKHHTDVLRALQRLGWRTGYTLLPITPSELPTLAKGEPDE